MESLLLLPEAPTGLASTGKTATSVSLKWNAVTYESGIKNYKVYRGGVLVGSPTATTFTVPGLTTATAYSFQVSAVGNDNSESEKSAALSVTTS